VYFCIIKYKKITENIITFEVLGDLGFEAVLSSGVGDAFSG